MGFLFILVLDLNANIRMNAKQTNAVDLESPCLFLYCNIGSEGSAVKVAR